MLMLKLNWHKIYWKEIISVDVESKTKRWWHIVCFNYTLYSIFLKKTHKGKTKKWNWSRCWVLERKLVRSEWHGLRARSISCRCSYWRSDVWTLSQAYLEINLLLVGVSPYIEDTDINGRQRRTVAIHNKLNFHYRAVAINLNVCGPQYTCDNQVWWHLFRLHCRDLDSSKTTLILSEWHLNFHTL